METLCTIGYTKKDLRSFVELLRGAGVTKLIDIRLRNTSQLAGFAKKNDLEFILGLCGIDYEHVLELAQTDELLDGYKKSKDWDQFEAGFNALLKDRDPMDRLGTAADGNSSVCLLCTEDQPEKCHRRLVAEYALAQRPGVKVQHLI